MIAIWDLIGGLLIGIVIGMKISKAFDSHTIEALREHVEALRLRNKQLSKELRK